MLRLNKIYKENCLEGMKRIPDDSVDLILCDLPYGVLKSKDNPYTKWDVIIPFEPLWKQYKRIAKNNAAIILTAVHPFAIDLINSNRDWFKYELIWCKSRASGFLNARKMPNKSHENVLVFYNKPPKYFPQKYAVSDRFKQRKKAKTASNSQSKAFRIKQTGYKYVDDGTRYPDSLLEFTSVSRKGQHPTEKPVDLFAWLIRSYSEKGDVVMDNCIGSGTTAIAAILEERNFIGFETDDGYFKMANERIDKLYLELCSDGL